MSSSFDETQQLLKIADFVLMPEGPCVCVNM